MRVLVTGGAGFVGSTITAMLIDAGHEVVVADDLSTGDPGALPDVARIEVVDVMDAGSLDFVIGRSRPEACVHVAAKLPGIGAGHDAARLLRNNAAGALTVIDRLVAHGCRRFVLSSTAAVYGDPGAPPVAETAPVAPMSAYGASLLAVEQALPWIQQGSDLRWAALRYAVAAGGGVDSPGSRVVGQANRSDPIHQIVPLTLDAVELGGIPLTLHGVDLDTADGTYVRDVVHVDDVARAHVAALTALDDISGEILNLGTGRGCSVMEVIAAVTRVTGQEVPTRIEHPLDHEPPSLVLDPSRAHDLLAWAPTLVDIDDIVADAARARARRAGHRAA